jgi:hypothetical protein
MSKRISKRTPRIRKGALFRVGWDVRAEDGGRYNKPYVLEGSIVEAIGLPGQTVVVRGRGYEVEHGKLAFRVIEGELSDRKDLRGVEAVGFCFQANLTRNEDQLQPINRAAEQLRDLVLRQVGVRDA